MCLQTCPYGYFCHCSWHACSTWMGKDGFIAQGICLMNKLIVHMYRNWKHCLEKRK